jgi:hypothetical protein
MRRRSTAILALALVVTPAVAAPPTGATPSGAHPLGGAARDAFESGKILFRDGDFAGALVKFKLAYETSKDPRLLWNMAACEKNQRHYANVLRLVERYLSEGASVLSEKDKAEGAQLVAALKPLVSEIAIEVDQAGATIFVDDEQVGTSPLARPVLVDLGARKFRVTKPGFKDAQLTETIAGGAGGAQRVAVKLEREENKEAPQSAALPQQQQGEGKLEVTAGTADAIEVDGRRVGAGRWQGPIPAGPHHLRVSAPEMRPYDEDLSVRDGESRTVQVTLEPIKKSQAWLWLTGGAILAAGAGVVAYLLLKPSSSNDPGAVAARPTPPSGNFSPGLVQLP